jgi:hypothetical protein
VTSEKTPSRKGELRRRWRAMLENGSIASLRSEGRLVALYVLYAADWSSCEVRFSMRHAARLIGVHPTAVRRGVGQLVSVGIIENLGASGRAGLTRFVIGRRAHTVSTPDTSRVQGRAQAVSTPDTSGAQGGHEPCPARAQPVSRVRTLCARNSVLSSGIPVNTSGYTSAATPAGGLEPPQASRPSEDLSAAAAALPGVDEPQTLKDEDT